MAPRVELPGPLGVIDVPPRWIRPCSVNHWGEGVLVAATPPIDEEDLWWRYFEIPSGVVSDGAGGAFVLSICTESWLQGSQGLATVRHVSASGVPGPIVELTLPRWWPGVAGQWADAAIVASGTGRAIVAAFDYQHRMTAQRYDTSGTRLWSPRLGVRLSTAFALNASANFVGLVGEEDGKRGAIFAWRERNAAGAVEVRAQRISRNGLRQWGAVAPRVAPAAGAGWPYRQPWTQLVATPKGGAIVVAPEASGGAFRYVATPISPSGVVGAPTTLVASTGDDWIAFHRLRLAVPDGDGGLFLGCTDAAGAVRLLRYTPGTGVRWSIVTGMPIDVERLAVHEDGRGGVLVAGIGGTPEALRLRRYDASGAVTFDIDAVALPLEVRAVPAGGTYGRDWKSRSVVPLPDGTGGAIVLVHEILPPNGPSAVITRCFDAQGRLVTAGPPLTSHDWGQVLPRAAVVGIQRAVVAYTQYEDQTLSGYDVSAQRVGCCVPQEGDPPPLPPFGCEILPLPYVEPGRFDFRLPCGNRERGFGVIPLSRFVTDVPGLRAPGGLATHDAPAPAWARLEFRNAADGLAISLCTLGGKLVAEAKTIAGQRGALALTFRPPKEADLLLVVSHEGPTSREASFSFDVAIEHGSGRAPALPRNEPARSKRKARKATGRARR